jgi:nucleoside-diphosphate-sugar epimerase
MPDSPTRVLTGASGWFGRAYARSVTAASARPLRALVQTDLEAAELAVISPHIQPVVGDIRDPAAVDRLMADVGDHATVVHAAAVIHPRGGTREFFDVNVGGTALVLDRAVRAGVRRFVHLSSNSPFGVNPSATDAFDESSPYAPIGGYGESKMEAELLVARAHERHDLPTVVLRPPWFYGPHQPARQTRFFSLVRRGLFPLCGSGHNRRSMVHTDNLVAAVQRAEEADDVAGGVFWVADARPYPMAEVLEAVRQGLSDEGLPVRRQKLRLPGTVADAADRLDRVLQGRGRYVAELHVLGETDKTIACDITKSRVELGYEPSVEIYQGMRSSIRWCLERGDRL